MNITDQSPSLLERGESELRLLTTALVLAIGAWSAAQHETLKFQDVMISSVKPLQHGVAIGFESSHRQYVAALTAHTKFFALRNGVRVSITPEQAKKHIRVGTKMSLEAKMGPKGHLGVLIALLLP